MPKSGKFATRSRDLGWAVLMFSMYLLLNFRNLGGAISKLSNLVGANGGSDDNEKARD